MKRCIQTHVVKSFGEIPEGSLWADDSEYVTDLDLFEDVDETPQPVRKKPPVRKFGQVEVGAPDGD